MRFMTLWGTVFSKRYYENALAVELRRRGLKVVQQMPIAVHYAGEAVGEYYADLVVGDGVIVEIKAAKSLAIEHEAQLLNYLKATPYEVGLLLNFGPKSEHKRRAFENNRKAWWLAQQKSKEKSA